MGLRLLISAEDDDDDLVYDRLIKHHGIINVALITVATCGADNIGIYVPYFVTLSNPELITVLLTFLVMLTVFCLIGYELIKVPVIANLLEKYGRWITAIVYILIGVGLMWESGTFTKILSILYVIN